MSMLSPGPSLAGGGLVWAYALVAVAVVGPACGALEGALGTDSTSRCQLLSDKLDACPQLFGSTLKTYFLDAPGQQRALSAHMPELSQPAQKVVSPQLVLAYGPRVRACALRLDGASSSCQAAFAALTACIKAPSCEEVGKVCQAPISAMTEACAAMFGSS